MSVEFEGPYRMPQPEQWLSEHPFVTAVLVVAVWAFLWLVFGWLS